MKAFEKIIGYDDIKHELYRVCDTMKNSEKYKKMGVRTPRGILLYGEPGIGKTMMANAIIQASGRNAFVLKKNKTSKDFSNCIRKVFEEAKKKAPCIVLLDDMDKFSELSIQRNSEEYVMIQSCIDECREREVFVLATVNRLSDLPPSLLRAGRFDIKIKMNVPEPEDIFKIVQYYLSQKNNLGKIDVSEIAKLMQGYSCADLEKIVNEAGIYAAYEDKEKIEHQDIVKACMRIIFDAPECEKLEKNSVLETIATHEAGHVVIAELFNPGSVNIVSIRGCTGAKKGFTNVTRPKELEMNKEKMEQRILQLLAGKASIEILKGVTDVGCTHDLSEAFNMVEQFINRYCAFGFEAFTRQDSSQFVLKNRDRLISKEVERYYQIAKKMLICNKDFLIEVRDELLQKKVLMSKDILTIRSGYKNLQLQEERH